MTKYIDAEKLVKAIEEKGLNCSFALKMERLDTLALIDSLQQEQLKVDLKEEIASFFSKNPIPYEHITDWPLLKNTALHFFNLGLNARKED